MTCNGKFPLQVSLDYQISEEHNVLMNNIISISSDVYNSIGPGLSEVIYHNGLLVAFRDRGIQYDTEFPIPIRYGERIIGSCRGDIMIDGSSIGCKGKFVLELKSIRSLKNDNHAQLKAYLKHLKKDNNVGENAIADVGFLINFPHSDSSKVEIDMFHVNNGVILKY